MRILIILLLLPFIGNTQGRLLVNGHAQSGFSPDDISGLKLWVKADQIGGLADGDPISTWSDQSGTSNDLTSSLTARPTYETNELNSLPVVRFDGSNDVLSKSSFSGVDGIAGMTVFLVVKQPSLVANNVYLTKWDYATQGSFAYQTGGNSDEVQCFVASSITDAGVNHHQTTNADLTTTFHIITIVYDGSQGTAADRLKIYKNDGSALSVTATGTIPTSLTTSTAPLRLGSFGGGLTRYFTGDMAEVILYDSALSGGNVTSVLTYLNNKWAVY